MNILSAEQILSAAQLKRETVSVPELGGSVVLQEMTGAQRDAWEASRMEGRGKNAKANLANFRAALLVECIVGPDGKRLFSRGDIPKVGALGAGVVSRLYDAAAKLNGISAQDEEELTATFPGESVEDEAVPADAGAGDAAPEVLTLEPE